VGDIGSGLTILNLSAAFGEEVGMAKAVVLLLLSTLLSQANAADGPRRVNPDYEPPRVVYDFYLDHPAKINAALDWLRSLINPLTEPPYSMAPEFMDIKVVIHGTEIVTVAKKNYDKYKRAVERMRYYHQLGVEFKVCSLAAEDYGYAVDDFQDFIDVVPSAFTELVHWQQQGYALIVPKVYERTQSIDAIR
jgi:intracellular sulfur oxidation DsrE/DsrF family protein